MAAVPAPVAPTPLRVNVEPKTLAGLLLAEQPGWPVPASPVAPPPRDVRCAKLKCVALTFDDGPGEDTHKVLDRLADHGARATFFVLGKSVTPESAPLLRRMVAEGHEIGNHSWGHPRLTGLSTASLRKELSRTQAIVQKACGVRMRMMRPPYGATNERVEAETRKAGLAQILWGVDTRDWRDRDPVTIVRRAGVAKKGEVVLLHDIHRTTVAAVPRLLDSLGRKNFTFVTVSELFGPLVAGKRYFDRGGPSRRR